ncbi:MAG: type II toxin-antitoxin system VapC family toxin [Methanosarcinales archaeon]
MNLIYNIYDIPLDENVLFDSNYDMNFIILTEKSDTFKNSIALSKKYSLMAKDAYIASFAKSYNICNIATNDSDFTRVDFLTVWRP